MAGLGTGILAHRPSPFRVPSEVGLTDWFERGIADATHDDLWLVGLREGKILAFERAFVWRPGSDAEYSLVVDDAMTTLKVAMLVVALGARRTGLGTALTSEAER